MVNKKIKVCPHCGSTDIDFENVVGDTPREYCKGCNFGQNFVGGFVKFPEVEKSKLEEFRKEIEEKKKNK